uniref:Zinc knuckle containing protein n=1 Tax=Oryza sativa subsp. japonica TaxID=39947 RepID=Q60DC1_ORYSJ|nr:zinc knuckle containing protein [Oryza sativa Japonica Group]
MRERGRGERAGARDGGGPRPSEARPTRRKLVDAVDWWTGRPLTGLRGAGAAEVASTRVWQDEEHGGGSPTREEWRRRRGWSRGEAVATAGRRGTEGARPRKKRGRGMKTPLRAHDYPNFQNSIDKSLLQEYSTVKEGSGHKRKTSPSEVDMQDVPQCQTMQPCQDIPKYPTLKSKKIRHVPGLICFICHEIGHYMRHCPQKPYMDALLQANMRTSRTPFYPQGSPNSQNVNTVRPTSPDDKRAKASCDMCQDIQEKKEMQEYKKRKVSSVEIQERESSRQKKNPPVQHNQGASQYPNSSGYMPRSTVSESSQHATMINSNSHEGSNSVSCPPPSKRRGYKAGVECFICHEMGHYSWDCLQKVKSKKVQPTTSLPNVSGQKKFKATKQWICLVNLTAC